MVLLIISYLFHIYLTFIWYLPNLFILHIKPISIKIAGPPLNAVARHHKHKHTHTYTHIYTHIHTYTHIQTHTHIYTYAHQQHEHTQNDCFKQHNRSSTHGHNHAWTQSIKHAWTHANTNRCGHIFLCKQRQCSTIIIGRGAARPQLRSLAEVCPARVMALLYRDAEDRY